MENKNEDLRKKIIELEERLLEVERNSPKAVETFLVHRFKPVRLSFISDWLSKRLPNIRELLNRISPFKPKEEPEQFNATLELMRHLPAYKLVRIARKYRMDLEINPKVFVKGAELSNLLDEQRATFNKLLQETRSDLRAHFEREKYQIGRPLNVKSNRHKK